MQRSQLTLYTISDAFYHYHSWQAQLNPDCFYMYSTKCSPSPVACIAMLQVDLACHKITILIRVELLLKYHACAASGSHSTFKVCQPGYKCAQTIKIPGLFYHLCGVYNCVNMYSSFVICK